ncbi:MAG: hypothetical protein J6M20_07765 [Clostridia bacterium]|nr:hypothetical protein [Clostridia bacterium]
MFLRKLTVMVAPLLLALLLCLLLPVMNGLGFWSNVLKGILLGVTLALLLPISGAGKRREPFAGLLWIPALLLAAVVVYQYLSSMGMANLPVLDMLSTRDGQVVLVECTFVGYMATQCIRTRK